MQWLLMVWWFKSAARRCVCAFLFSLNLKVAIIMTDVKHILNLISGNIQKVIRLSSNDIEANQQNCLSKLDVSIRHLDNIRNLISSDHYRSLSDHFSYTLSGKITLYVCIRRTDVYLQRPSWPLHLLGLVCVMLHTCVFS